MTTKDLFELTKKHESQPWWPAGLVWDWEEPRLYLLGRSSIDTHAAERLLLGSAVMWLLDNSPHHINLRKYAIDLFEASTTQSDGRWSRTSPLAAVLAACEEAHKAGGEK